MQDILHYHQCFILHVLHYLFVGQMFRLFTYRTSMELKVA